MNDTELGSISEEQTHLNITLLRQPLQIQF